MEKEIEKRNLIYSSPALIVNFVFSLIFLGYSIFIFIDGTSHIEAGFIFNLFGYAAITVIPLILLIAFIVCLTIKAKKTILWLISFSFYLITIVLYIVWAVEALT